MKTKANTKNYVDKFFIVRGNDGDKIWKVIGFPNLSAPRYASALSIQCKAKLIFPKPKKNGVRYKSFWIGTEIGLYDDLTIALLYLGDKDLRAIVDDTYFRWTTRTEEEIVEG